MSEAGSGREWRFYLDDVPILLESLQCLKARIASVTGNRA